MSEVLACRDGAAWEAWLADHHTLRAGVWLRIARKGSGQASVSNDEALDVALCYGWINGQRKPLDGSWYLQRYTPRRPQSTWSKVNVDKVEALTAAGRMRAPGMAEVEAAKADGRWDAAYEPARTATVPPDLAAARGCPSAAGDRFGPCRRSTPTSTSTRSTREPAVGTATWSIWPWSGGARASA
jgi:uncharacterized protein YdeI (YjbR/CyaY-like superfamily)